MLLEGGGAALMEEGIPLTITACFQFDLLSLLLLDSTFQDS